MAKVSNAKESNKQPSAKSMIKTTKTAAKMIKTLKSTKNVKNVNKIVKKCQSSQKGLGLKKKVVNGKTAATNSLDNKKFEGKPLLMNRKSHGKQPVKPSDGDLSSARSKPSKKGGKNNGLDTSKAVTRRSSKEQEVNVAEKVQKTRKSEGSTYKAGSKEVKTQSKTVKRVSFEVDEVPKKKAKELIKKPVVGNRQRVAGLNATCKVKMMYEVNEDKSQTEGKIRNKSEKKVVVGVKKISKKVAEKKPEKITNRKGGEVTKKKLKKKVPMRTGVKRKNQDDVDTSNIIDSRSSKRVASLNASAILAATLLPDPPMPKLAPKSKVIKLVEKREKNPDVTDVAVDHRRSNLKKKVVQQGIPVTEGVMTVSPKSHVSIKKTLPMQSALQLMEGMQPSTPLNAPSISRSSPNVTGVTTTKLEVTKVQINSSSSGRKEKTDHQVKTILGKDFVSKYQIQTKSSQSYCVQVHNSSVETHHQPFIDSSIGGPGSTTTILSAPPPAHMDSNSVMTASQTLSSPFSTFAPHLHQPQAHSRPLMQVGSVQGLPAFSPLSILNIPHFALSGSHRPTSSNLRPNAFGLPPPLDLSHGNYSPAASASSGFTLLGHSPMYQPAGPMIQSNHDSSCPVHKPVPFHPPSAATSFQPHITQSLSSVSGSIFTTPGPSGLFSQQHRLQQSHIQSTQPCTPIYVSNIPQPNLGFYSHSPIRASLPLIQGSGDGFAPRNVPWFHDSSPRSAPVYNYTEGSASKSAYQAMHFPRSPHVATVRPQVCKKQKEPLRSKKNQASIAVTKDVVTHRQPSAMPSPSSARRDFAQPLPLSTLQQQSSPLPLPVQHSSPVSKTKKKFAHGWSWFGKRFVRRVFVQVRSFRSSFLVVIFIFLVFHREKAHL